MKMTDEELDEAWDDMMLASEREVKRRQGALAVALLVPIGPVLLLALALMIGA